MADGLIHKHNDYYDFAVASWDEWLSAHIELTKLYGKDQPNMKEVIESAKEDWERFRELLGRQAIASTSYVIYCALYLEGLYKFLWSYKQYSQYQEL